MRQLTAFIKKESMELLRSGRFVLLLLLFCLFGVMNPAIAKLTPWMVELLSDQLADNGMTVGMVEVDAMTSWMQFYKNMPIMLIVTVVMFAGILVGELQKGTLIVVVAKGMKRCGILGAKAFIAAVVWTGGYLISFVITYAYSAYFWDQTVVAHLFFGAFCFWLFGLWILSIILPASVCFRSAGAVILAAGIGFVLAYVLTIIPLVKPYSPVYLSESMPLLTGERAAFDYAAALCAAAGLTILNLIGGTWLFNRKQL